MLTMLSMRCVPFATFSVGLRMHDNARRVCCCRIVKDSCCVTLTAIRIGINVGRVVARDYALILRVKCVPVKLCDTGKSLIHIGFS